MFAMEITEHDKSKRNENAKIVKLPDDDPRCHGLAEGLCRMACDTCPFVSRPIKDEYSNRYRMKQRCDNAHKTLSAATEQPVQPSLASQNQRGSHVQSNSLVPLSQPVPFARFNQLARAEANATTDMQLSAQLTPMEIVGTSTTTNGRKTQSSTNDQGVVRKQITRHMADGTVEHEVSEEHKKSTTETQIVEYQQTITHLQSQLQLVDSKWTEAKDECHDLQRNSTALSDVMGTAVCEAVMKKAPGMELTVALLLIPRLLLALEELKKIGKLESFYKAMPSANTSDPYIMRTLKERGGAKAFNDLMAMTPNDYKKTLPNLFKVGATPDLLCKLGILPSAVDSDEEDVQPKPTLSDRGAIYFWDASFIIDYPTGELPSLLKANVAAVWKVRNVLTHWIHLHLTRDDGERPELVKILEHGFAVQAMLPQYNWQIVTCFLAYECVWKHSHGKTYKCYVSEDLIQAHYPEKVQEYNRIYGI
jgi:hypothetical protein